MKRSDFTSGKQRKNPFDPKIVKVAEGTPEEHVAVSNGAAQIQLFADGRINIIGDIHVYGGMHIFGPSLDVWGNPLSPTVNIPINGGF